ncbi:MAG: cation diffusion facilitator family transporter [Gemmatimonadetes bacterium]|nr:cation diffusion facilitator family transporter [Gemmatimonadota bacterium]
MASGSKGVVYAALFGNGAIAVTKFVAAAMTGSSAMLAEGVHSVADTGNQALMLLGLKRGDKPPDRTHPFGYGKEVFFWGLVVAIVLFAVGAGVSMYEGILHLLHPAELGDPTINYIVLAIAAVFETGATSFAVREFLHRKGERGVVETLKDSKDPALFVVLFEDSAALAGILVAAVGVFLAEVTGNPAFDAGASIVIGLILAAVSLWLVWETRSLLVGEAARTPLVEGVRGVVQGHEAIERIGKLLTMHMGPDKILVVLSVDFRSGLSAEDVERAAGELERTIREEHRSVGWVFIEGESFAGHVEG